MTFAVAIDKEADLTLRHQITFISSNSETIDREKMNAKR